MSQTQRRGIIHYKINYISISTFYITKKIFYRFVSSYFSEPDRKYGQVTSIVFHKLRNTKFSDIWLPAKEQFNGEGSFGSGGAMRITPLALFFYSSINSILTNVEKCTKLTHTHNHGINGALLQVLFWFYSCVKFRFILSCIALLYIIYLI